MSFLDRVGRYQIKQPLGQGGMASVYLAYDPNMNRDVAVKVLAPALTTDREFTQRFQREAEVIAGLEYETIVPVYDYGMHDDRPYMVMRYMSGGTLERLISDGQIYSLSEAAAIMNRVCSALDAAHNWDLIHRDVKPGNILFNRQGEAFLADFGIVKIVDDGSDLTRGAIIGTAAYLSPEQVYGDARITHLSDVYALGVVLFEMLTGQRPFTAPSPTKLMMKHVLDPVPNILDINNKLPEDCAEVIFTAMAKSPIDRYQSAGDFATAVEAVSRVIPSRRSRRRMSDDVLSALDDLDGDGR